MGSISIEDWHRPFSRRRDTNASERQSLRGYKQKWPLPYLIRSRRALTICTRMVFLITILAGLGVIFASVWFMLDCRRNFWSIKPLIPNQSTFCTNLGMQALFACCVLLFTIFGLGCIGRRMTGLAILILSGVAIFQGAMTLAFYQCRAMASNDIVKVVNSTLTSCRVGHGHPFEPISVTLTTAAVSATASTAAIPAPGSFTDNDGESENFIKSPATSTIQGIHPSTMNHNVLKPSQRRGNRRRNKRSEEVKEEGIRLIRSIRNNRRHLLAVNLIQELYLPKRTHTIDDDHPRGSNFIPSKLSAIHHHKKNSLNRVEDDESSNENDNRNVIDDDNDNNIENNNHREISNSTWEAIVQLGKDLKRKLEFSEKLATTEATTTITFAPGSMKLKQSRTGKEININICDESSNNYFKQLAKIGSPNEISNCPEVCSTYIRLCPRWNVDQYVKMAAVVVPGSMYDLDSNSNQELDRSSSSSNSYFYTDAEACGHKIARYVRHFCVYDNRIFTPLSLGTPIFYMLISFCFIYLAYCDRQIKEDEDDDDGDGDDDDTADQHSNIDTEPASSASLVSRCKPRRSRQCDRKNNGKRRQYSSSASPCRRPATSSGGEVLTIPSPAYSDVSSVGLGCDLLSSRQHQLSPVSPQQSMSVKTFETFLEEN